MHFRAIFLHLCVVTVIPNLHVKDHFNWPSRLSPRVMWICPRFQLNLLRPQRENRNSTICWIFQNQKLSGEFSLIFENSSPKGFSWQNMKKSVFSVLKMNSWYLQSLCLKDIGGSLEYTVRGITVYWTDRKWVYNVPVKNDWMHGCSDHLRGEGDQWGPGYWPRSCRGCEAKTCITWEKEATYGRFSVLWRLKRWGQDSKNIPSIIFICWKKLRFVLIFVTKYFHKVKNITEIMIKIYQRHCRLSISYFALHSLVN